MSLNGLHGLLIVIMIMFSAWLPVSGRLSVEKSSIHVLSPTSVVGTYDSAIGNFGIPKYGGSMAGKVVYPTKNANACKPFSEFGITFKRTTKEAFPIIALVDGGDEDCSFALKVLHAEQAGAAAVLVADPIQEDLVTMDTPDPEDDRTAQNITIPSALVDKSFGDKLKTAFKKGETVNIRLDWRESMPYPDNRVEYEFWTNGNDECGPKCETQMKFLKHFRGAAQLLERGRYTLFTPHYITYACTNTSIDVYLECKPHCTNHGRYCSPEPSHGDYEGKAVIIENLRQLCVHRVATELKRPWVWWDYMTDFQLRCPMKDKLYNGKCAEKILKSLNLPHDKVEKCMGDTEADAENPVLQKERDGLMATDKRSYVSMSPTLLINNVQYRGRVGRQPVLKAICAGFQEGTEPAVCHSEDIQTNECLTNNGGCWKDGKTNVTACKDTFRGRVCECPVVKGIQLVGDGYISCETPAELRCRLDNGGCWQESRNGTYYTACNQVLVPSLMEEPAGAKCICPHGFVGNGLACKDVDECKTKCQCKGCHCTNTWGSYDCQCDGDYIYIREHDTCIRKGGVSNIVWFGLFIILTGLVLAAVVGCLIYKYRMRSYMDSEIRSIMAQYLPLDNVNQNEVRVRIENQ